VCFKTGIWKGFTEILPFQAMILPGTNCLLVLSFLNDNVNYENSYWLRYFLFKHSSREFAVQNTNLFDFAFPPNSSLSKLLSINAKASHDPQLLMGQSVYKNPKGKQVYEYMSCIKELFATEAEWNNDKMSLTNVSGRTNLSVFYKVLFYVKNK
jgi:hypothetical protein